MICGPLALQPELGALVVPERPEHGVDAAGEQRGREVEADVAHFDRVGVQAGLREDRLQVCRLVVDPRRADRLSLQIRGAPDLRLGQRDDRGERILHDRRDADDAQAEIARPEHLGLVRDGEVDVAGGDLLDRGRGIWRLADLDVEARLLEVAARLRRVDAGVVGVREVVEHQLDPLRAARLEHVLLLAAAGEQNPERREQRELPHAICSFRFQGQQIHSARATSANSATAIRVKITIPAYTRGVWS